MCSVLTALTLGASAGASAYGQSQQAKATRAVSDAQNKVTTDANQKALFLQQAERDRTKSFQDQSQGLLQASQDNASKINQDQQEAALKDQLAGRYNAATAVSPNDIPGLATSSQPSDEPTAIKDAYKQAFGKVGTYLSNQANAKGALDAFGNLQQGNSIYNTRQLQQQGLLGTFMQGSNSALANELAANNENANLGFGKAALAGTSLANSAALWSGLGRLGMSAALSGAGG